LGTKGLAFVVPPHFARASRREPYRVRPFPGDTLVL